MIGGFFHRSPSIRQKEKILHIESKFVQNIQDIVFLLKLLQKRQFFLLNVI